MVVTMDRYEADWAIVEPATEKKPGKVRHVRAYPLKPGMAKVYDEGDVHSPRRDGPTRLIRIEGTNVDKVTRLSYEKVRGTTREAGGSKRSRGEAAPRSSS